MTGLMKKAGLGIALAVTTLSVAAPADAQRWRRYDRGNDVATGAILGGIVGLGVGAAIASSNRDRYYDDRRFYDDGYYQQRPRFRNRYYAPPRRFYRAPRGYYAPRYAYPPQYYRGYGYGY